MKLKSVTKEQEMQLSHPDETVLSPPAEGKCAFVLGLLAGRVNVDT